MDLDTAIEKAKQNDQAAFKFLVDTYWNEVFGFQLKRTANENDAEDITIQTFSKAFDKLDTYNPDYQFNTWLIAISKNLHIDLVRKSKAQQAERSTDISDGDFYEVIDDSPSVEDRIIMEQNLAKLLRDIKKLKPHYQEVINLRYFQELSYKEISEEIGEPINNIKIKLLRAKKLLLEIISNKK